MRAYTKDRGDILLKSGVAEDTVTMTDDSGMNNSDQYSSDQSYDAGSQRRISSGKTTAPVRVGVHIDVGNQELSGLTSNVGGHSKPGHPIDSCGCLSRSAWSTEHAKQKEAQTKARRH